MSSTWFFPLALVFLCVFLCIVALTAIAMVYASKTTSGEDDEG